MQDLHKECLAVWNKLADDNILKKLNYNRMTVGDAFLEFTEKNYLNKSWIKFQVFPTV